ncbi:MAG: hypothetical protein J0G29_02365 [Alphaproteobacteria bacterium]|nr:hypothetical protein [Alphaproteobacteria bacterium]OJV45460.1 MAG: hypothetical protein BGO28_05025 [Alphaproteobacteria bacterium 43-37]
MDITVILSKFLDFLSTLSWPLVVFVIVRHFSSEIKELISKINRIDRSGVSIGPGAINPETEKDFSEIIEKIDAEYQSKYMETMDKIDREMKVKDFIIWCEWTYNQLSYTQLYLLSKMEEKPLKRKDLANFFKEADKQNILSDAAYGLSDYLIPLENVYKLVTKQEDDEFILSDQGRDLLEHMKLRGYKPEDKIYRSY